ncbi:hypothetical protein GTP38_02705 [Duganella sp. FT94W]|uniref:Molecular chaperone n=1 Tax=Duganella lactea TaxID=2692173 RepID=A0ABW9V163_9BURK|nr:hypothetical protein [Duganella lactea]
MKKSRLLWLLLLPLLAAAAPEPDAEQSPIVVVNGTRSPDLQPYRYMLSGLEAFEDQHALAPNATEVRFRLMLRDKARADAMEGVTVRIVGSQSDIPLPLDESQRFVLPRDETAEEENADIVLNKNKRYFSFWPEVRSAGVPAGMRRLGDIRLECRVLVAIGKNYIPFMLRAMINTLTLSTDWCGWKDFKLGVRSDGPVTRATLLDGETRVPLAVSKDGKSYNVPVGNKRYADDALIEVE